MKLAGIIIFTLFFAHAGWAQQYTPAPGLYKGNYTTACVWKLKTTAKRAARAAQSQLRKRPEDFQQKVGDKFLHCSVSCKLTKRCGRYITYFVGLIKEITDQFSSRHDSEINDMRANNKGIKYGLDGKACYSACEDYGHHLLNGGRP